MSSCRCSGEGCCGGESVPIGKTVRRHVITKKDAVRMSNEMMNAIAPDTLAEAHEHGLVGSMDNKVELTGWYGGDETHALSAWTSTSRDLDDSKRDRMGGLLNMLAKEGHHTPFEKSYLHFLVTCDTATHIHLLKHRVGVSVNGESARYKEHTEDKYLIPHDWSEEEQKRLEAFSESAYEMYHHTLERLVNSGMDRKRAKESARFYLPYSSQITMDVSFNFRSFMHFYGLRGADDAQLEVRELAHKMLQLVKETGDFDLSLKGFGHI